MARMDRLSEQPTVNMYRVAFQPSARTAWHAHSGLQLLLVIEGRCRVQQEGESIQEVATGAPFASSQASATGTAPHRTRR